jgi:hypothetical protein
VESIHQVLPSIVLHRSHQKSLYAITSATVGHGPPIGKMDGFSRGVNLMSKPVGFLKRHQLTAFMKIAG